MLCCNTRTSIHRSMNAANSMRKSRRIPSSSSTTTTRKSSSRKFPNMSYFNSKKKKTYYLYFRAIASRLPFYIFLFYTLQEDSISPLPICIDLMVGPSMIPTIYTHEVYLRLRPVPDWINDIYHWIKENILSSHEDDVTYDNNNKSCIKSEHVRRTREEKLNYTWMKNYKVGDVVIIKDFKGTYACKRIIGVENDEIWKYGQYAIGFYSNEDDFGIKDLTGGGGTGDNGMNLKENGQENEEGQQYTNRIMKNTRTLPSVPKWDDLVETIHIQPPQSSSSSTKKQVKLYTKIKIPKNHIWVEGDNPLESIDSRHYGPVHIDNVRGRIVYRLWPRIRVLQDVNAVDDEIAKINSSCWMSNKRPKPPR